MKQLFVLIFLVQTAKAQYLAGTATESIEPDSALFSLTLGGYGAPRDGRFSLEWVAVNDKVVIPENTTDSSFISTCTDGKRQYGLTAKNEIYYKKGGKWLRMARKNGVTYDIEVRQIFVANNHLYAIDNDRKLFLARHSSENALVATALAIKQNKQTVVIVGVDLVGFDYALNQDVKTQISRKHNIPAAAIFINASHTHFAPVTQKFDCWGEYGQRPDSTYLNNYVKAGIIRAIEKALANVSPARLYFGRGTTDIGYNRCLNDGLYDNAVDVLKVTGTNGKLRSVLFLTSCHPVFRNEGKEGYTMSPNYPGVTRQLLIKKLNTPHAIFLQGCAGDINPRDNDHTKTGLKLTVDVMGILSGSMTELKGALSYSTDSLLMPVKAWDIPTINKFRADNDNKPGDVYAEKNVRWADMMLNYYKTNQVPESMPIYLQAVNVGNWKLLGISREVVSDYSFAVKKLWPGKLVTVAGYTGDISSYLPAQKHIKAGTYEGYDSFFWYGQPGLFDANILDVVVDKIKTVK